MDVQTAIKVQTHQQSGIRVNSFLQGFPANPLFPTTIRGPEVGYPEIILLFALRALLLAVGSVALILSLGDLYYASLTATMPLKPDAADPDESKDQKWFHEAYCHWVQEKFC
jgi:hypothetical protein